MVFSLLYSHYSVGYTIQILDAIMWVGYFCGVSQQNHSVCIEMRVCYWSRDSLK